MVPGNEVDFSLESYWPPAGDAVDFSLGDPEPNPLLMSFEVRGKVGRPEWDDPLGVYGIYQMRMTNRGKVPIKMKFYEPTNPRTAAQQANRQKFADAMAAWGNLTEAEQSEYNEAAKKKDLFGWNLFIREYFQNN